LFGHLVGRFTVHPENIATEALVYVARSSPSVRSALAAFVQRVAPVPSELTFRSQASGGDGSIPDIVGDDRDGRSPVIIEAKFWAGFTPNQPGGYLNRLVEEPVGVVLFVVPGKRLATVQQHVVGATSDRTLGWPHETVTSAGLWYRRVGANQWVAVTSWDHLLSALIDAAERAADAGATSDLRQLKGLCNSMDTSAFTPLSEADLSPVIPTRITQYLGLLDDLAAELRLSEFARDVGGKRQSSQSGLSLWWGYALTLGDVRCLVRVSMWPWATSGRLATPLWLQVQYPRKAPASHYAYKLQPLLHERGTVVAHDDFVDVALMLPLNVEREKVLEGLTAQVRRVADLLNS
jgi:hypothetical protein